MVKCTSAVTTLFSLVLARAEIQEDEGVISGSSEDVRDAAAGYYNNPNTVNNYEKTWGAGNVHFGYFPNKSESELTDFASVDPVTASDVFSKAAETLSREIANVGEMDSNSVVLDLGCGQGKPLMDIARYAEIKKGFGVDVSSAHIKEAKQRLKDDPQDLPLDFVEGSFADLPQFLRQGKFTHVTSNVAICHLHEKIDDIFRQAYLALEPGGAFVAVDFLGPDHGEPIHEITKEHVWKRLKFRNLLGHTAYQTALMEAGFEVEIYERLDEHICYGYAHLAAAARQHKLVSEDGVLLADNYDMTVKACHEYKDLGMNLFLARKPDGSQHQNEEL